MEVWFRWFSFLFMGDGCRFQPLIFQNVIFFPAQKLLRQWTPVTFLSSFVASTTAAGPYLLAGWTKLGGPPVHGGEKSPGSVPKMSERFMNYTLEDERLVHLQPSPMKRVRKIIFSPNLHFWTWNPYVNLPGCIRICVEKLHHHLPNCQRKPPTHLDVGWLGKTL